MDNEPVKTFESGRLRCSVFVTNDACEGLGYEVELFRWEKPTKRSEWKRVHRHGRHELQDLVDALNAANEWMAANSVRIAS